MMRYSGNQQVITKVKLKDFNLMCQHCCSSIPFSISIDWEVHWHKYETNVLQIKLTCQNPACEHMEVIKC